MCPDLFQRSTSLGSFPCGFQATNRTFDSVPLLLSGVPDTVFTTTLHLSMSFPSFPENLSPRRFHNRCPYYQSTDRMAQCVVLKEIVLFFFVHGRSFITPVYHHAFWIINDRFCTAGTLLGHVFFFRACEAYCGGHSFPTSSLWVYSLSFVKCMQVSNFMRYPQNGSCCPWLFLLPHRTSR